MSADTLSRAQSKLDMSHLNATAARLKAERPSMRRLDYALISGLEQPPAEFDDELVEGLIGRAAMAVIYGDSNSGKTFYAVDLAANVSLTLPALGRRTAGGAVVYLATEAPESVQQRFKAWERHHGMTLDHVAVVRSPVNLFDGMADVDAVVEVVDRVASATGLRVVLIVGDTLARMSAGANENSGEDMGVVIRNAEAIRKATGATFLWVSHTGKDAAKGMRGWSGMRAAIDTELEVTADEATGLRAVEVTKQRDLPGKGTRLGFRLDVVPLGVNRWGTERNTCVIVSADAPAPRPRGKRMSEIAGAVVELLTAHGTGMLKGRIVKHFEGRYVSSAIYRELKTMVEDGRLIEAAGIIAMPGRPAVNGGAN